MSPAAGDRHHSKIAVGFAARRRSDSHRLPLWTVESSLFSTTHWQQYFKHAAKASGTRSRYLRALYFRMFICILPFSIFESNQASMQSTMSTPIDLINKILTQSVDNIFAYKSFDLPDAFYSNIQQNISQTQFFKELDIRPGAGLTPSAFTSSQPNDILSTIITPSYSLPYFVNTLLSNQQKFHFNVPALNCNNKMIFNDYSTALSFANSLNYIIVSPINKDEVEIITLLSLALYKYTNNSVLNLFDSLNYTQTTINNPSLTPTAKTFHEIDQSLTKTLTSNQSTIDQIITKFNEVTQNQLNYFQYHGDLSNDEVIFITFGSIESELFATTVKSLPDTKNIGVLNIRIPIPFNQNQFIENLPSTTKKIIIIIDNNNNNNNNILSKQINATLFYHAKIDNINVSQYNYDSDFIWSQMAVLKIISSYTDSYRQLPQKNHEGNNNNFIYWGNDNSQLLLNNISLFLPGSVTQRIKFDNLTNGGIIQCQFNLNENSIIGDNIDIDQAKLAFIQDPSILSRINVIATLQDQATLIINQQFIHHDLTKLETFIKEFNFSPSFINDIKMKNIKIVFIQDIDENMEILKDLIECLHENAKFIENQNIALIESLPEPIKIIENQTIDIDNEQTPTLPIFPIESAFKPSTNKANLNDANPSSNTETVQDLAKKLCFKEAYGIEYKLRPDLPVENFIIKVKSNKRVTPIEYDRYIFNIEFDISNTGLKYDIGEALGIHAKNDEQQVDQFIKDFNLDSNEIVLVPNKDNHNILESRTLFQSLVENLDLFGKPPKRFYEALIAFVTDKDEREILENLIAPENALDLKRYQDVEYYTYVDILKLFKSAKWNISDLIQLIPPLKRREYSIASSQKAYPNEIHLLIVVVDWIDKQGRKRFGQASKYLSELNPGQELVVSVKPSVMKLPPRPEQPIIMSGLGTGLAPFKAILEEKIWQMEQGMKIGKIFLYLGSRHKREEYLYGELWEAYKDAGIITHIGAAFSRDQPQKIYIQDRIRENLDDLKQAFIDEEGVFYLCGPTWPVPDVTKALQDILAADANERNIKIDLNNAIEELKESSRYILEVY